MEAFNSESGSRSLQKFSTVVFTHLLFQLLRRNKLESLTTTLAQMKTERIKQENRLAVQEQG